MKINNKAQAWGIDLMMALVIFSMGIVVFYIYSLNTPGEAQEAIEKLFYDGKIIANTILSEGYPENWIVGDVKKPGILNKKKINDTKLERFYDLIETPGGYSQTKRLFDTRYDYYFFLDTNMIIDGEVVEGIGKNDYENARNLIKITRFVVYQNKPMTAYLYVWEE